MAIARPHFCRLDYLTSEGWWTGHHGVNLVDPERYAQKCVQPVRVTIVDTGEEFITEGYEIF